MTRKQRRLALIGSGLAVLAVAAGLVLFALNDSIVFFNSPTDVAEKGVRPGERIRLGGLVADGSIERGDKLLVHFEVTDGNKDDCRRLYAASCPTCSARGRAWSPRAASAPTACSRPTPCWPSTTRTTCRARSSDALKKQGHWEGKGPPPAPARRRHAGQRRHRLDAAVRTPP